MMHHRFAISAAAAIVTLPVGMAAAEAAPVRIDKVQYDSPGSDGGSNSSLNAEWVVIKNFGRRAKQLNGWTLRDTSGHVYRFGRLKLRPGRSVTVHTGNGSNGAAHRYWRQDWYVWNNDGDTAILRNRGGDRADSCHWGDGDGNTGC